MKFASAVLSLFVAVGSVASVDASMTIRGNTKSANKLMTFARRLDQNQYYQNQGQYQGQNVNGYGGYYGDMDEESMYFLNNYSIKLLSCIEGQQVVNYENGEMEGSTVIFRLCPSDSCDADSALGCDEGYGDFAVGINTFIEAYSEQQEQQQQNNGNGNGYGMVAYNQYGQEFDASEYMECREYNVEEQGEGENGQNYNYNYNNNGQNNNGQNNNGQYNYYQNAQFFIGPGCSEDSTNIVLNMYMDEWCSYPAEVSFGDIAYGWDSMPFSDGGLVSLNCYTCYGPNENYEYELSRTCSELYSSSSSRCESNMQSYSYYGQSTNGCSYVNDLVSTIYGNAAAVTDDEESDSDNTDDSHLWDIDYGEVKTRFMDTLSTREARLFIAGMVIFALSLCIGSALIAHCCVKKRAARKRATAKKNAADGKGDDLLKADETDDEAEEGEDK